MTEEREHQPTTSAGRTAGNRVPAPAYLQQQRRTRYYAYHCAYRNVAICYSHIKKA